MQHFIVLLFLILTGCAARVPLVWEHPQGFDTDQRLQAQQECRELAAREARYQSFYYGDQYFPFHRPFYYHRDRYNSRFFWYERHRQMKYLKDSSRFYRLCMEAKGWQLVPLKQGVEK